MKKKFLRLLLRPLSEMDGMRDCYGDELRGWMLAIGLRKRQ